MKKVGLLNFHFSNNNYGAVLQAAALSSFLRSHGFCAETIDFIPNYGQKSGFKYLLKKLKNLLMGQQHSVVLQSEIFEEFRRLWLPRSTQTYNTLQDLIHANDTYDAYVVGSDQVWRPKYTLEYSSAYFLSFVPKGAGKVAYAPSFGVEQWELPEDDKVTLETNRLLKDFTTVSVREKSGQDICQKIFNLSAELVLDPTLLVGAAFFDEIIEKGSPDEALENIVYYKLDVDEDFNTALSIASEQLNTTVENIYHKRIVYNGKERSAYNDVPTWLNKIKNAKLVITDSFHCTCFAILFQRPFLYYPNPSRGFARIESLFSLLGVDMKCVVTSSQEMTNIAERVVSDFESINKQLNLLRKSSAQFLLNSLGESK